MSAASSSKKNEYARMLLSGIILAALFWVAKPFDALIQLSTVLPQIILILLAGFVGVIFLNGAAEWWLYRSFSTLSFPQTLQYYVYSWSTELFLPGKLGMFSIAYFLKEKVEIGKSVAVVLLTKFVSLLLLLALGVSGLVYYNLDGRWWMYGSIAAAGMAGVYVLFFTEQGRSLIKTHVLRDKAVYFSGFSHVLGILSKDPIRLGGLLLILLAAQSVNAWAVQQIFLQAGYSLGFLPVLSVVSLVTLMGLIPISFNGLGLKEAALVTLMIPLGVPTEVALALGTMSTAVGYLLGFGIGLLIVQKIPLNEIQGWWNARRTA